MSQAAKVSQVSRHRPKDLQQLKFHTQKKFSGKADLVKTGNEDSDEAFATASDKSRVHSTFIDPNRSHVESPRRQAGYLGKPSVGMAEIKPILQKIENE